jgi:hypothetical protein
MSQAVGGRLPSPVGVNQWCQPPPPVATSGPGSRRPAASRNSWSGQALWAVDVQHIAHQQPVHATLPCWGAALVAWWACQQASSSAWMAAWVARATSRRRASGCPKGALAERAIGERVGPVDLGEEHAVGEEAVGAEHRGAWSGSFLVVA